MAELADAIDVSRPTLSRFFRDPSTVRPGTASKIRARLEGVDYVPNFFATRMNRESTGLVGVVIPSFNDLFYTSLLEAIEDCAVARGWTVVTQCSHGSAERESHAADRLVSMSVDGAIVAPLGGEESARMLRKLSETLPTVVVDARPHGAGATLDFVGTDNRATIGLMVDYLCRTGEPPIFFAMPQLNSNSREREQAFRAAMGLRQRAAEILPVDPGVAEKHGWDFEAYALEVMDDHFAHGRLREATILCANDRLAIGASRAAQIHGLWAGDQDKGGRLRIAGHDDHPLSRYMSPPLTTVAQDVGGIAAKSVELLHRRVTGPDGACGFEEHALLGALRIRQSA